MTARSFMTFVVVFATAFSPAVGLERAHAQTNEEQTDGDDTGDQAEAAEEGRRTQEQDDDSKRKLSDRIKSVQRKAFLKRQRFEFYPHVGIDLNDAFFAHLVLGGSAGFHVVDSVSLEGRFGYVLESFEQEPVRFLRQAEGALLNRPPRFEMHGELDVLWAPLYGKISLFGEGILHFDTYIAVGGGVFKTDAGLSPAVNFGLGQRYFLTDWLVARLELRDYVFPDTRNGESDIQNLLMVNLSVSVFLPASFEYEYQ